MLAAFVLMVLCAGAGMALTFWALRDNLRRMRRTPYRPPGQDTRGSATPDESIK
jgi:heme O synthase-like polyprenyltransferase